MNYKLFALVLCAMSFAHGAENQMVINQTFVPDTTSRAYTVMVEAGAKLLEFDIIRARVQAQEKALVDTLQHETFTSTAGKALGVLGPLEQLAHGFDDIIPVFLVLQNAIAEASASDTNKVQCAHAVKGLVDLLATPEVLHAVLPQPELVGASYRDAMTYAPTAMFVKAIQAIAHKKFMLAYCDADNQVVNQQPLPNGAHLFYGVVKQTVANMFGDVMKVTSVAPVVAAPVKVEPKVEKQDKLPKITIDAKPSVPEFSCSDNDPRQDLLHQAVLHDSAGCIKKAVKLGADFNQGHGDKSHLLWAVLQRKSHAVEALLDLGAKDRKLSNEDLAKYSMSLGDIKSAYLFVVKGGVNYNVAYGNKNQQSNWWPSLAMHALNHGDIKTTLLLVQRGAGLFGQANYSTARCNAASPMIKILSLLEDPDKTTDILELIKALLISKQYDAKNIWQESIGSPSLSTLPDGYSLLRCPHVVNNVDALKLFLSHGANPNESINMDRGLFTWTPLTLAIAGNNKHAVETLLEYGANIDQPIMINQSCTPLAFAIALGCNEIVELLTAHGASL